MKHKFSVIINADASKKEAREYIEDAVTNMGGCFRPEDPFFGLRQQDVKVFSPRNKRRFKK
jgi:hypothetical protein